MQIITLTTDFGTSDWFIGAVKGIILTNCPQTSIIDISHDLKDFNIKEASFFLKNFYATFPKKTIHCVIVDPTVGSKRKIIAIKTKNYYFIAPNNGVLTHILQEEEIIKAIEIEIPKNTSTTFHGRDVFAPAAALLANKDNIELLGLPLKEKPIVFNITPPSFTENIAETEVVYIDKFGNIILSITNKLWDFFIKKEYNDFFNLHIGSKKYILKQVNTYSDSKNGELLLILGSCGHIEVALNLSSAATKLKIKNGTKLKIEKTGTT